MFGRFIILIFIIIYQNLSAETIPEWYINRPKNNNIYLYTVGKNRDIASATTTALEELSGAIIRDALNIDNSFSYKVNFGSYSVENIYNYENDTYVLLSVGRSELYSIQVDNLRQIHRQIEKKYKDIEYENDFIKIQKMKDIIKLIEKAKGKIEIITILNKFDDRKYTKYYNTIEKDYKNLIKNLNFKIVYLNNNLKILNSAIVDYFNNYGIEIKKNSDNILYVENFIKRNKIGRIFVVDTCFRLKLVCNKKLIYYNSYNYRSTSRVSFETAEVGNIKKFINDILNNKIKLDLK